jgi:hypothetical protein
MRYGHRQTLDPDGVRAMPSAPATHERSQSALSSPSRVSVRIARGLPIQRTAKVRGDMDHEMINPALREWLAR